MALVEQLDPSIRFKTYPHTPRKKIRKEDGLEGIVCFETVQLERIPFQGCEFTELNHETIQPTGLKSKEVLPENIITDITREFYAQKGTEVSEFSSSQQDKQGGSAKTYLGEMTTEHTTWDGRKKNITKHLFVKSWEDTDRRGMSEAIIQNAAGDIPGVPRVFYFAEIHLPDGRIVSTIAMDYVDETNLTESMHKLSLSQRAKTLLEITSTTEKYHKNGIVHRDIKPDNILMEIIMPRVITISDFGISAFKHHKYKPTANTKGIATGTLRYMSPEQLKGDPTGVDYPTDTYSIGSIAFEILTGYIPNEKSLGINQNSPLVTRENLITLMNAMKKETLLQKMNEQETAIFMQLPLGLQQAMKLSISYNANKRPDTNELKSTFQEFYETVRIQ